MGAYKDLLRGTFNQLVSATARTCYGHKDTDFISVQQIIMEESAKCRLKSFLNHLNISEGVFETNVGIAKGAVSNFGDSPRKKTLDKIKIVYPELNIAWLLTGNGEMLKDGSDTPQAKNVVSSLHAIKYYPNVDGAMGGVQFLDNPNETAVEMSIPGYTDCKFAINAYGESMSPLIKSGQIVLLAEWRERFIDWGKIYLVVTKSGYRVIKRLFPGDTAENIICRSENMAASPDFKIDTDEILHIYLVKGWVCRDVI